MFTDRRRLCRWAAQVLLVWVFGVAMGVANACALAEPAHHRSDAATTATPHAGQPHLHGHEQGDAAEVNCLDFCGKSSIAASQLKVVDNGFLAPDMAPPVTSPFPVASRNLHSAGRRVVDSPNLPGGPPPRIAFQRLAL